MIRVLRFLRGYVQHPSSISTHEDVRFEVDGEEVAATYIRRAGKAPLPGWILLHGITVPGRHHPVLLRFAHGLASSGASVLIPDVPAWRRLQINPAKGDTTIAAAARYLNSRSDILSENLNLVGFSFGATQALMSAAKPGIREYIRAVVGFGGYADLGQTLHFMMTGEHEWKGVRHRTDPDPYGRWIVAGNYLTDVPGHEHMEELRRASGELAAEVGRRGAYAAEKVHDALKRDLRATLPKEQQELWDLLAPQFGVTPPLEPGRLLGEQLLEAAIRRTPQLDPRPLLPSLDQRIVLAHGYEDRLIPYTETLRLQELLAASQAEVSVSITRLFAHSREAGRLRTMEYPGEIQRYVALLQRALRPC